MLLVEKQIWEKGERKGGTKHRQHKTNSAWSLSLSLSLSLFLSLSLSLSLSLYPALLFCEKHAVGPPKEGQEHLFLLPAPSTILLCSSNLFCFQRSLLLNSFFSSSSSSCSCSSSSSSSSCTQESPASSVAKWQMSFVFKRQI